MRRNPKALRKIKIKKIAYFFKWKQCDKCKMEFRREYGWKCISKDLTFFLCFSCFNMKISIVNYFLDKFKKNEIIPQNYIVT